MKRLKIDRPEKLAIINQFLKLNQNSAKVTKNDSFGTENDLQKRAKAFEKGREVKLPEAPSTVPDDMVSIILEHYFSVPEHELEDAKQKHLLSMGAENIVGDLLERYLAQQLEQHGWAWCSGSIAKSIDFIRPPEDNGNWVILQVKNRDNSENSSSAAVRGGTQIEKWFRTFSRTGKTNWDQFPDKAVREHISEKGFKKFVEKYLKSNLTK